VKASTAKFHVLWLFNKCSPKPRPNQTMNSNEVLTGLVPFPKKCCCNFEIQQTTCFTHTKWFLSFCYFPLLPTKTLLSSLSFNVIGLKVLFIHLLSFQIVEIRKNNCSIVQIVIWSKVTSHCCSYWCLLVGKLELYQVCLNITFIIFPRAILASSNVVSDDTLTFLSRIMKL
jgi:hypothetical protein